MSVHVYYVGVFEASHHMYYSVYFTYVPEKFIAEAFSFGCTPYEACYVTELDSGVNGFL